LIDGSGSEVRDELQTIVVEGTVIREIGPASKLKCPPGAGRHELNGMTVMPGLIDCHDHLANIEGSMVVRAGIPPTLAAFMTAEALKDTVLGGFTSIRDASGVDLGMKMAVDRGFIQGPRLKISINILSQLGGHNDHTEAAGIDSTFPVLQGIPAGICDGPSECRKKTREMIRAGADWIKIATTGGVGTPIGGPLLRQFSPEEVQAIVDTAHAAGKPVMSHAYGGEGVKICLDAGVDSIEHGSVLDDSLIDQMVRQGTWLVPTFSVLHKIAALGELDPCPVPAYMPEKALFLLDHQKESFQKALSAGVKMALGTDCGGFGHGQNSGELKYLVEAGMSPLQALTAATGMGAACMGFGDVLGVLKKECWQIFLLWMVIPLMT
jgi:imidazolonepropionase-like amidohydrolase